MESWARSSRQPPTYEAYVEFAAGQERWNHGDMRGAAAHFIRASEFDSSYVQPLLLAAMAHNNVGESETADSLIAVVAARRPTAAYDRALLDFMRSGNAYDHAGSVDAAARLSELGGLGGTAFLINELIALNRPGEAVAAARSLDPTLGWIGNTGWGFEIKDQGLHFGAEYQAQLDNIRPARARWPTRVAYLFLEAEALAGLGRVNEVNQLVEEALTYPAPVPEVADVILSTANELTAHGHAVAGERVRSRALSWLRERPQRTCSPQPGDGDWCDQLSRALYESGRFAEAAAQLGSMPLDTTRNGPGWISELGRLGALAIRLGKTADAATISTRLAQDESSPFLMEGIRWERARLAAVAGDTARAISLLREACVLGCPGRILLHRDVDFDSIRHLRAFRELAGPVAGGRPVGQP
jgi:hypothetical protein